jgi:molecular chaperone DnaK (HSP70)
MEILTLGIDFGTTNCAMATVDLDTGKPEVITNEDGKHLTPSVVCLATNPPSVGEAALLEFHQAMNFTGSEWEDIVSYTIPSIKRRIADKVRIESPAGSLSAIDVGAEIVRKLVHDADKLHFHRRTPDNVVVAVPASFSPVQRKAVRMAVELAGLKQVDLIEEPVAAAMGFAAKGLSAGRGILVYDLGGGTFDLAFVLREDDGAYRVAFSNGDERCGGDDFDRAILEYFVSDGAELSPVEARLFSEECRRMKEALTHKNSVYGTMRSGGRTSRVELTRSKLENLIAPTVKRTIRLTREMLTKIETEGHVLDTAVLIGGSTRIPYIQRQLRTILPFEPLATQYSDTAVALGAAIQAHTATPISKTERIQQGEKTKTHSDFDYTGLFVIIVFVTLIILAFIINGGL